MTPDEIRDWVQRFVTEINKDDWSGAFEIVGEAVPAEQVEGMCERHRQFREAFPDYRATIEQLVVEGRKYMAYLTIRATHEAEFPVDELKGIAATGKAVTWAEVWFGEFDEHGQLRDNALGLNDRLGRLQQLGGLPGSA